MRNSTWVLTVGLLVAASAFPAGAFAQNFPQTTSPGGWMTPNYSPPPITDANRKPAPKRSLTGTWIPFGRFGVGTQAGGVSSKPNNGRPENALPYTPFGLDLYKSHKALEGADAVRPAEGNDPRNLCEPLGMPRTNHYNLNVTQVFQDEYKVVILYQYDNRWRIIWTDGRELPKVVDGGVEIGGEMREQRFLGYSVGKWVDDYTLEVQTVGTMPEDRVWLDATGRPISDQIKVTERLRRVDYDTIEWSEVIDDPKIYTKPWETMKLPMRLHDGRTDVMEYYCSPVEQQNYNKFFGSGASGK
jgi:DNA-binding protein